MKYFLIAIVTVLLLVSLTKFLPNESHLFILSGQSNMNRLDLKISFKPTVEEAFGKDNVIIVKDTKGGQPIREWYKEWKTSNGDKPEGNGELYDRLMTKVNTAIEGKKIATVTFLWMQGENDTVEHGDVYKASLNGLLDQLRSDLGRDDLNYVIGRLSDYGIGNEDIPYWMTIREAQVEVAEASPRGAWVNTDDLNDGVNQYGDKIENDVHYSVEGYKIFGKRLADKAIELIESNAQ